MSSNMRENVFDFDPATHQGALPSPCVDICQINPENGYCNGCLRSMDEIVHWGGANEAYKLAVWYALKSRIHHTLFKDDQNDGFPPLTA